MPLCSRRASSVPSSMEDEAECSSLGLTSPSTALCGDSAGKMNGGDLSEDEHVMSEIHLGCPPAFSGPHSSLFTFSVPSEAEEASVNYLNCLDEDGDLVLNRRRKSSRRCLNVVIQHNVTSSIPDVGLQVWRAELLLSDLLLHKMSTSSEFDGIVSLELGAGTGLAGLLLARAAKTVFLTDHGAEILDNCAKNVELNSGLFNRKTGIRVRELDWMNSWPPRTTSEECNMLNRHSWTSLEVEEAEEASLLVAADVIYSDDLTDAFFRTVETIMSLGPEKVLYLALEKRYNFSLNDLDVVANGYARFLSYLQDEEECSSPCLVGKRIDVAQVPQYMRNYERGDDVEIWHIKFNRGKL